MNTITQVVETMQTVLTTTADRIGRETKFVKRERKLNGSLFAQILTFGWLGNAQATMEDLTQIAVTRGVEISSQGLEQRFTPEAADCLKQILEAAVTEVVVSEPTAIPILARFNGVYLQDSSTISLPDGLEEVWRGCGGNHEAGKSALKIQVQLELHRGELRGPFLQDGKTQDRSSPLQEAPLPKGSLLVRDLGYWSLKNMQKRAQQGEFWLSRVMSRTLIIDSQGQKKNVVKFLCSSKSSSIDVWVQLGQERVTARLLALRVPPSVAEERRRRIREQARSKGQTASQASLVLADWFILVTNVPVELLSLREAMVLARARWQIELLFKLWKSQGGIAKCRSQKPWRILCEVYAKLLCMVMQHWVLLLSCWRYPNRSLWKAAQSLQSFVLLISVAFDYPDRLEEALILIQRIIASGCRMNNRKKYPNTYQLLLNPSLLSWEGLS